MPIHDVANTRKESQWFIFARATPSPHSHSPACFMRESMAPSHDHISATATYIGGAPSSICRPQQTRALCRECALSYMPSRRCATRYWGGIFSAYRFKRYRCRTLTYRPHLLAPSLGNAISPLLSPFCHDSLWLEIASSQMPSIFAASALISPATLRRSFPLSASRSINAAFRAE